MATKDKLRTCTKCGVRGRFGIRFKHLPVDHLEQKAQPRCRPCRRIKTLHSPFKRIMQQSRKTTAEESKVDSMTRAQMSREFRSRFPEDKGIKSNWYMREKLLGRKP